MEEGFPVSTLSAYLAAAAMTAAPGLLLAALCLYFDRREARRV